MQAYVLPVHIEKFAAAMPGFSTWINPCTWLDYDGEWQNLDESDKYGMISLSGPIRGRRIPSVAGRFADSVGVVSRTARRATADIDAQVKDQITAMPTDGCVLSPWASGQTWTFDGGGIRSS